MSKELHIALYSEPETEGSFHWALVVGDIAKKVVLYQIRMDESWKLAHRTDGVQLRSSRLFKSSVRLGPLLRSVEETKTLIEAESPTQDGTEVLWIYSSSGRGWSCSQWVLRVLEHLVEQGYIEGGRIGIDPSRDWKGNFWINVIGKGKEAAGMESRSTTL
ncbi:hypothetical protein B0H16DRAFT_1693672 [Mycena metata]|uniref:Uncharacterized protein n=1 Tax=Mycena metata TaxID=1033252 RepID=A0AAD7N3G7_9AGAR|nr:hypothetical protein B0H16DRAFT_1693672 [Mycena metata]